MKFSKSLMFFLVFILCLALSSCSLLTFQSGHFITSGGNTAYLSFSSQPEDSPGSTEDCYYHRERGQFCAWPYYPLRILGEASSLLLIIFFPVSIGLDVAFSPIALFIGLEAGIEDHFITESEYQGHKIPKRFNTSEPKEKENKLPHEKKSSEEKEGK